MECKQGLLARRGGGLMGHGDQGMRDWKGAVWWSYGQKCIVAVPRRRPAVFQWYGFIFVLYGLLTTVSVGLGLNGPLRPLGAGGGG